MIVKTILAAGISAAFAGGVVYYGTGDLDGDRTAPWTKDKVSATSKTAQDAGNIAAPKTQAEPSNGTIIDRLLGRNTEPNETSEQIERTGEEQVAEREVLDNETVLETPAKEVAANTEPSEGSMSDEIRIVVGIEETDSGVDKAPNIENASLDNPDLDNSEAGEASNNTAPDPIEVDENDIDSGPDNTIIMPEPVTPIQAIREARENGPLDVERETIKTVMSQADRIKTSEIKDQAYLDVVNYAVARGLYWEADAAMTKIKQVELRDTARSQIAIALVQTGRTDEAFEIIEGVEIDELKDVMRLQLIETMILPQRVPEGLMIRPQPVQ